MKTRASIRPFVLAAALLLLAGAPQRMHAAFTLTLQQVGPDVVLTGSGTVNLSALEFAGSNNGGQASIRPDNASVYGGPTSGVSVDEYVGGGFSGPSTFGAGPIKLATSGSGSTLGVLGAYSYLVVPGGYVSGTAVTESATFANQTFATLGFTPGVYTYTWGSGLDADSLTVTGVPEPATWLAGALLVLAAGNILRRRLACHAQQTAAGAPPAPPDPCHCNEPRRVPVRRDGGRSSRPSSGWGSCSSQTRPSGLGRVAGRGGWRHPLNRGVDERA